MTNIVDFLAWATGGSANVESQAAYAADSLVGTGFEPGIAQSNKANKVWRQSSFIAAAIANWVSQQQVIDVLDDGNLTTFIANHLNAIKSLRRYRVVQAASTANVNLASPGSTIDGYAMQNGDGILIKNQTTGSQNGIYQFNGSATPMTLKADASVSGHYESMMQIGVSQGSTQANSLWALTTVSPITLGTTALVFVNVSSLLVGSSLLGLANTWTATNRFNKQVWSPPIDLGNTGTGSTIIDLSTGNNFKIVANGATWTLGNPTNGQPGQSFVLEIWQDATGGRVVTYGTNWISAGAARPVLSTVASAQDVLTGYVDFAGKFKFLLNKAFA